MESALKPFWNSTPEKLTNTWQIKRHGRRTMNFERAPIHIFKRRFCHPRHRHCLSFLITTKKAARNESGLPVLQFRHLRSIENQIVGVRSRSARIIQWQQPFSRFVIGYFPTSSKEKSIEALASNFTINVWYRNFCSDLTEFFDYARVNWLARVVTFVTLQRKQK